MLGLGRDENLGWEGAREQSTALKLERPHQGLVGTCVDECH